MHIIRSVKKNDINAVERCALTAGIGMTHLPRRRDVLEERIASSVEAIQKQIDKPVDEEYMFVLEDLETSSIGGTCGIFSKVGVQAPFYVYRVETLPPPSHRFPVPKERRLLRLHAYENGPTEVCALYLLPEFRHSGLGRLLSLCRFLYIASFPNRFEKTIIANLRGVIEKNIAPFWDGLSRHFLDVEFDEVMAMRSIDETFLPDILPLYPIYVSLLSPETQQVIGKIHANTAPALAMLEQEGFQFIHEVDPIDGGPTIACAAGAIRTIKESKVATVSEIVETQIESEKYIVSNNQLDFRACYGAILINNDTATIQSETAKAIQVNVGDSIRYILAKPLR